MKPHEDITRGSTNKDTSEAGSNGRYLLEIAIQSGA